MLFIPCCFTKQFCDPLVDFIFMYFVDNRDDYSEIYFVFCCDPCIGVFQDIISTFLFIFLITKQDLPPIFFFYSIIYTRHED